MKHSYTIIIERGCRVVREFDKPEAIIEAVEKLFGLEMAEDAKQWLDRTIEGSYRNNGLRIHKIIKSYR